MKILLAMCLCALSGLAAEPAGIQKIAAYEGTWKIETEHFKTRFSEPSKESSTLRNDCWASGAFYACDQFVDGVSKALVVFTYNAGEDTYRSIPISPDGGGGAGGKLIIKGNVWTFPWEQNENGKTIHFRVVNVFTSPGTIEYRQEFSEDEVHWTVTAKGLEHRMDNSR